MHIRSCNILCDILTRLKNSLFRNTNRTDKSRYIKKIIKYLLQNSIKDKGYAYFM